MSFSGTDRTRRTASQLMTTLTALCTFGAVGILLIILSYIAMRGIGALNLRFLFDSPRPVGEGGAPALPARHRGWLRSRKASVSATSSVRPGARSAPAAALVYVKKVGTKG